MQPEDVQYGQRIRINLPGVGDHGHVGTVKHVRGSLCSVQMDRDQRRQHVVMFFAADLDLLPPSPPAENVPLKRDGTI